MEKDFEKKYHDVETRHWWFKSRRNCLMDLIKDAPKTSKILDIGCSSGIFLKDLETAGFDPKNLYGIDISPEAIDNCKKNGLTNTFVMDAQEINLDSDFDIIIASDCLEHLEFDQKALKNWKSRLKTGGKMYVFVPAFQSLWSYHDTINMHFRRYTNNELKSKIKQENLTVIKSGYWNFALFLPIYAFRKITSVFGEKNKTGSDITVGNEIINGLLLKLLNLENKLLSNVRYPFGVSTFCIAEKTEIE